MPKRSGKSPAGQHRSGRQRGPAAQRSTGSRSAGRQPALGTRQVSQGVWELVHPQCAVERADDIEDVEQMLEMGEFEIAQDELRWLLSSCSEFVTAHKMLGELALGDEDLRLARAHFGYAYHAGNLALEDAGITTGLPYERPANREFLEATKGLAWCLHQLGEHEKALAIGEQLRKLDPTDPLDIQSQLLQWRGPCG